MTEENPNPSAGEPGRRSWTEDIELAGNQLVTRVQELIKEGNVRRLIIRYEGRTIFEIPLVAGAAAGVAAVWLAPMLAALGAFAALLARVEVRIEREGEPPAELPKP